MNVTHTLHPLLSFVAVYVISGFLGRFSPFLTGHAGP